MFAVSGCSGLIASSTEAPQRPSTDVANEPSQGEARQAFVVAPEPSAGTGSQTSSAGPLVLDDLLGEDGRLSVLILGSDRREGIIGERTDAIIVATISPDSGKVAMVSMPRDTVNVPIGPDQVFRDRINTLYWHHTRKARKQKVALKRTVKDFEFAFDTEIDYYALVDFKGLVRLINSIGGIEITLEEKLHDPTMHILPDGLKLKAGDRHLDGKKTLAFSRTRHTDSDYHRSRRQQQVLTAVGEQVRSRGLEYLPRLMELVSAKIVTDFPIEAAPLVLGLAGRARLDKPKSVVLEPGRFARAGRQVYTITPRVAEVRKLFSKAFRPLD
jgi:LCP family protein required for cell wall assembly